MHPHKKLYLHNIAEIKIGYFVLATRSRATESCTLPNCLIVIKMSSVAAVVRVGCGCIVQSALNPGCVLLGKRMGSHGAGKYALPGGHLELGETWENCLIREVKEETNLEVEDLKLVHVTVSIYVIQNFLISTQMNNNLHFLQNDPNIDGNVNKHYITIFMRSIITKDSPEVRNMEPHKCESWSWVPWTDIVRRRQDSPETLFEPMCHLIDGLLAGGRSPFD